MSRGVLLLLLVCVANSALLGGLAENLDLDHDGFVQRREAAKRIVDEVVTRLADDEVTKNIREIKLSGFQSGNDDTMTGGAGLRADLIG